LANRIVAEVKERGAEVVFEKLDGLKQMRGQIVERNPQHSVRLSRRQRG
jgi:hypothetical protein